MAEDFPYTEDFFDPKSERKIFTINVKDINEEDVEKFLQEIKNKFKQQDDTKTNDE